MHVDPDMHVLILAYNSLAVVRVASEMNDS